VLILSYKWPEPLPAVFSLVGNTPTLPIEFTTPGGRRARLHLKLEGANPSGSVKDRAAVAMIRGRIDVGDLRPGGTLLDASSGNMACALAMFGRALGVGVTVVCNDSLTADKRRFIAHFGGRLIDNDFGPYTFDGNRKCRALLKEPGGDRYCFLDQLHNWDNPRAHETGTGPEILRDVPGVRLIVGSLGSGGTMAGVARAVRNASADVLVAAVHSASGSRFPGVGAFDDGDYVTPFLEEARKTEAFDFTIRTAAADVMRQLAVLSGYGMFCGPQTGAVTLGALRLADEIGLDDGIAVISGDAGWKNWNYLDQLATLEMR
jgi:[CysO sulfur-carrier protein]-thiocarboxylate-dependent cysteine synthase